MRVRGVTLGPRCAGLARVGAQPHPRSIGALALALGCAVVAACGFSAKTVPDGDGGLIDAMIDTPDAQNIDGAPGSARKKRITIPEAKVFGDVTNFPIWLVIDDMVGLGAKAAANGGDIYFTKIDGSPLEWELVAWNKATGHLEAWVRVDLTDAVGGEIDMRYGDPGPVHVPNAQLTFSNGFLAVWHLDDTLGAGSTTVADARGVVMGTATNGPAPVMAGKLGRAVDFDGSNDEVTFTNPLTGAGSHTISAWVSLAQPTQGFSSVLCIGNPSGMQSRFLHTKYSGLATGFYGEDVQTTVDVNNSTFTLLHWVYESGTKGTSLYRDGVQVGTTATVGGTVATAGTGGHIGSAPMNWGPGGNTTNPVNGLLDEVRISNAARTLGWIRTEHANQSDVKMFYSLGPELPAQ